MLLRARRMFDVDIADSFVSPYEVASLVMNQKNAYTIILEYMKD